MILGDGNSHIFSWDRPKRMFEAPIRSVHVCFIDVSWLYAQQQDGLNTLKSLIARFMGLTWGPPGADRTQVGPMLAPWSLRNGRYFADHIFKCIL